MSDLAVNALTWKIDLPVNNSSDLVQVADTVRYLHNDVPREIFAEVGKLDAVGITVDNQFRSMICGLQNFSRPTSGGTILLPP